MTQETKALIKYTLNELDALESAFNTITEHFEDAIGASVKDEKFGRHATSLIKRAVENSKSPTDTPINNTIQALEKSIDEKISHIIAPLEAAPIETEVVPVKDLMVKLIVLECREYARRYFDHIDIRIKAIVKVAEMCRDDK